MTDSRHIRDGVTYRLSAFGTDRPPSYLPRWTCMACGESEMGISRETEVGAAVESARVLANQHHNAKHKRGAGSIK